MNHRLSASAGLAALALGWASLAACQSSASHAATTTALASAEGAAVTVARGEDWPRFRGLKGDGISPEKGLNFDWQAKAPRLLWQASLTDDGYAGPAVAGGVVYLIDHQGSDDILRAWNLADGKELWRLTYADADQSNYGFSRSTPTIEGNRLYVVSRLGKVMCVDAKKGNLIWQRDMVSEFGGQRPNWDYAFSPVIDGKKLLIIPGGEQAAVAALDKATGKTIWQAPGGAGSYASPVVAQINGKKQVVAFLARSVAGFDAETGANIWSYPWDTPNNVNAATPLVIGNDVFIASGYGKGCAMLTVSGSEVNLKWQNRAIQAHFSSPLFFDGRIYGTGDPGLLVCLDPATGNVLWRQQGFEKGGMMAVDGRALVQNGSNGDVVLVKLDPTSYQELGRIAPLKGQAWTAPILANGRLIIRNKEALAVIDLG